MWQWQLYIHPNVRLSLAKLQGVMTRRTQSSTCRYLRAIAGVAETRLLTPPHFEFVRTTIMEYVKIS